MSEYRESQEQDVSKSRLEAIHEIGHQISTFFGGLMTVLGCIGLVVVMVIRLDSIYVHRANDFTQQEFTYSETEMSNLNVTFGNFNDSMNFVFGLTALPEGFDILNNPYVQFMGLSMHPGVDHMIQESYELGICDDDHQDKFLKPHTRIWYNQPLCFKNRDNVTVLNNWFMKEHAFPTIGIVYCKNTTENYNWCKSKDEVDTFLGTHPSYFAH